MTCPLTAGHFVKSFYGKQKVSARCRQQSEALKFLQSFDRERLETGVKSGTLSLKYRERPLSRLKSTHSHTTTLLYRRMFTHLQAMFGDVKLDTLRAEHFNTYKSKRLRFISPVTVNIDLRTLIARMKNTARWRLVSEAPFSGYQLKTGRDMLYRDDGGGFTGVKKMLLLK